MRHDRDELKRWRLAALVFWLTLAVASLGWALGTIAANWMMHR